jgi:hypothetical protein
VTYDLSFRLVFDGQEPLHLLFGKSTSICRIYRHIIELLERLAKSLKSQKVKNRIPNPTRNTIATAAPTVVYRDPSVSVSEKDDHYIPNNRGYTVRTGLPPRPSAASTLQRQRSLLSRYLDGRITATGMSLQRGTNGGDPD